MKQDSLDLVIVRGHVVEGKSKTTQGIGALTSGTDNGRGPSCRYVNLEMLNSGKQATVLLENPRDEYKITFNQLVDQVGNPGRFGKLLI